MSSGWIRHLNPSFFIPEELKLILLEMLFRSVPAARFWIQDKEPVM